VTFARTGMSGTGTYAIFATIGGTCAGTSTRGGRGRTGPRPAGTPSPGLRRPTL
jgi:hypothetical protein